RRWRYNRRQVPLRALGLGPGRTLPAFTLARPSEGAHSRLPAPKVFDHLQTRGVGAGRRASVRAFAVTELPASPFHLVVTHLVILLQLAAGTLKADRASA